MPKSNPNFFNFLPKSTTGNSSMSQKQLIDSITSHISLYHSDSLRSGGPSSDAYLTHRASILKWFSSLTVYQRQAHLTLVDFKFTQLLIQMLDKVRMHGHGLFIVLPDIPSSDPPFLPSLCFKRSHGLLIRVAESNESERLVFESTLLFSSTHGENVAESSCSIDCLDSATVSEELVEDVNLFVCTMDKVSNGRFLRGNDSELAADWVESEWLKTKGYYTLEAFVANRLEVALRLAWLNCNSGKKRGVKLKEKVRAAGVAANVFWRNKGCVDWWSNLDLEMRQKFLNVALGKAAKSLVLKVNFTVPTITYGHCSLELCNIKHMLTVILSLSVITSGTFEILKQARPILDNEIQSVSVRVTQPLRYKCSHSSEMRVVTNIGDAEFDVPGSGYGKPNSLIKILNHLTVLQNIVTVIASCCQSDHDAGKVFFTSLTCLGTVSDFALRKMRGLLMVISLDCMNIEFLGEYNSKLQNKSKENLSSNHRKKKGRMRHAQKLNHVSGSGADSYSSDKHHKDFEPGKANFALKEKTDLIQSNGALVSLHWNKLQREASLSAAENAKRMVAELGRPAVKKCRKGRKARKNYGLNNPTEMNSKKSVATSLSTLVPSAAEAEQAGCVSDHSNVQTISVEKLDGGCIHEHNSNRSVLESFIDSVHTKDLAHGAIDNYNMLDSLNNQTIPARLEVSSCDGDSNETSYIRPPLELDTVLTNANVSLYDSTPTTKADAKSNFMDKPVEAISIEEGPAWIQGLESEKFYVRHMSPTEFVSYEWPSVAPVIFPSFDSQPPTTTDRLHLDVSRNRHNQIRQPFIPTMHQARSAPVEGGGKQIRPRALPMSLDWPPVIRNNGGLTLPFTCNFDPGFIAKPSSAYQQTFSGQSCMKALDSESYFGDLLEFPEPSNARELSEECDSHWLSEEEFEIHAVSELDYNQYFGGGVMYWNPSEHSGTGFSRPPSLSSDDSSWAWREADMKRAVDDMVTFPTSYVTNGLTSPPAVSFGSLFDPLGPGHQALGYVTPANDMHVKGLQHSPMPKDASSKEDILGSLSSLTCDVEGKTGDSLAYPILRPIIIPNFSREGSRSDFNGNHDHRSPCLTTSRREQPRIKRPPSPVVLCAQRAPRLPPPSTGSDYRKPRGFPTVRSGSSSPRHWGVRGWYHEGTNLEEACARSDGAEVVCPSWRNKSLSGCKRIQPLSGSLLQDRLVAMSQLTRDQEHPDITFPLQPLEWTCPTQKDSFPVMYSLLHDEIDSFCKQVATENMGQKPYINWAVKRVTRSLQELWPRSRTNIFGSNASGLALPTSDVDLVVCLPPVRNLEPIKEAGILEGRNGIKETCLQHAARYLANQEWVKNDSLKTVENTAIPIIMLVVEVPCNLVSSGASNLGPPGEEPKFLLANDDKNILSSSIEHSISPKCSRSHDGNLDMVKTVRLDISFKSPSHTGLQTTELVKELTKQFPAATSLALVLKQFLADRSLDQSYSGGLSSYCLVLLITRFLQHEHHLGRSINQNFGSLLIDFLYFFGNVFDPRQIRISVQGSGVYIQRERGYSIDPIHIDDPLFPMNNVGRNCFRIHQCIKAFAEAYSILESELTCLHDNGNTSLVLTQYRLLSKIIPSINLS